MTPEECDYKGMPWGTRSQMVVYTDAYDVVAIVHRYLKPDGMLGAHGKPDPKTVMCCGAQLRQANGV